MSSSLKTTLDSWDVGHDFIKRERPHLSIITGESLRRTHAAYQSQTSTNKEVLSWGSLTQRPVNVSTYYDDNVCQVRT